MPDIYFDPPGQLGDLDSALRRRGHLAIKTGEITQTLFPEDRFNEIYAALGNEEFQKFFAPNWLTVYMQRFGKASFRKLVIRLLRNDRSWVEVDELRTIASRSTDD
jgi:hypothetical protein